MRRLTFRPRERENGRGLTLLFPIDWREFDYEYETGKLAVDLLSGGTFLREWVDDPAAQPADFHGHLLRDEQEWSRTREPYLLY